MRKKAIVTGASRGIGKGIAMCLAEEGYDLAISYVSKKEEADKVVEQISETYHTRCFAYQAALQEKGAGKALFDRAVADLGGLDLLVNNAGLTIFESLQNIQEETLDLLINLDFKNYILMMREAANYMIASGTKGNIINITSSRGEQSYPPVRRPEGRAESCHMFFCAGCVSIRNTHQQRRAGRDSHPNERGTDRRRKRRDGGFLG